MKNIFFKIMAGAALVTAFASCELNDFPTFDEADSFVAIDKTAIIVDETVGQVIIPVTIASIDPVKTAVTYEVVDSTAKPNKHYKADEYCILTFDGTARTQNIVIDIIDSVGVYTGDLIFSVNLLSGGKTINLGANSTCIVKISDVDHPLASILGEYSCIAKDKANGDVSWTMTMSKDPADVKVVWIDYICPLAANNPTMKFSVYGNVSDDMTTISIPCGQKPGALYDVDDPFTFIWFDYADGYQVEESGNVVMKSEKPGVWTTEDGMGFCSNDYVFNGGMILKGTAVWTKK